MRVFPFNIKTNFVQLKWKKRFRYNTQTQNEYNFQTNLITSNSYGFNKYAFYFLKIGTNNSTFKRKNRNSLLAIIFANNRTF